jgi:hypothetical protein
MQSNPINALETLKVVNAALAFFLELAMLAVFSYWGFHGEKNILAKWFLGIGTPLVVAILWGVFLSPNAEYRLDITAGTVLSLVLFSIAVMALYQTNHPALAIALASIVIVNQIFLFLWKQW